MPSFMITKDTSTHFTIKVFFLSKKCFSDYMKNIQFSKHIECEHWYYKVKAKNALKAHTEAVYKGIG